MSGAVRKKKKMITGDLPDLDQLREELKRERYNQRYRQVLRSTIFILIVVAAAAVLVAVLFMPVLQIYGTSMVPTLTEGDIVVSLKGVDFEAGDMVCFYSGNKLLVKRYIAGPGQWVLLFTANLRQNNASRPGN